MESKFLTPAKRMTRKEFWEESDRLLQEAQGFLSEAQQSSQRIQKKLEKNARTRKEVEQLLSRGKN